MGVMVVGVLVAQTTGERAMEVTKDEIRCTQVAHVRKQKQEGQHKLVCKQVSFFSFRRKTEAEG